MSLKPLEVKTANIATKAVTSDKIADNAIEAKHIKNGAVTPDKLIITPVGRPITPGIETTEIKDGAVTSTKLAPNAVTSDHIATNAVATDDIKDGAITTAKIRDGAITKEKMADGIIGTAEIIDGSITAAKLASNSVTGAKIAANAVGSSEIAAGAVSTSELATNAVSTEKIANQAVTAEKLAPGVGGGDRFTFGTLLTGLGSADVLYLTNVSADIPYTTFDLSAWVPEGAKAVLMQLGLFNQSFATGRAFFRVRTNVDQRDAIGVGLVPGANSQVANAGLVPLVVGPGPRTIEYTLESVGGPWSATLTIWITIVGYII
ncbi:MAG: hypothetical protein AB1599_06950 [Planctomycetota bacterium]